MFSGLHIGRLQGLLAHRKRAWEQKARHTTPPSPLTASPHEGLCLPFPSQRSAGLGGAAPHSHLTQESCSRRGRGPHPLWGPLNTSTTEGTCSRLKGPLCSLKSGFLAVLHKKSSETFPWRGLVSAAAGANTREDQRVGAGHSNPTSRETCRGSACGPD